MKPRHSTIIPRLLMLTLLITLALGPMPALTTAQSVAVLSS
jgi:hypothetical protein